MHLVITNIIAERLAIKDKTTFLLGGIAPDAVAPKDLSHFYIGEVKDYSRSIDYKGFLDKYCSQANNYYILGYYTHLIADDLWLKGFYLPWLKNRMDVDDEVVTLYHNDFQQLNGLLLEYFGFKNELKNSLYYQSTIFDIQEVKSKDVQEFIPKILEDMEYDKGIISRKLNVFSFNQIIGYIETSVDKSILNIKNILP